MAYTTAEGRQELLNALAEAADELAYALACLGEAYERLDETNGDALEERLFGPVQGAFGGVKRTYSEFAARHGRPARSFPAPESPRVDSIEGLIGQAVDAVHAADDALAGAQDSDPWLEVGDKQLRAGIAAVRERLAGTPERALAFTRQLGR